MLLSHPTANANVRAIAKSLTANGMLEAFFTSIGVFPGSLLDKVGEVSMFSELKRRAFDSQLKPFTWLYPWWETGRIISQKLSVPSLNNIFSIDNSYKKFDRYVASALSEYNKDSDNRGVYAYEDGALETFIAAKKLGVKCIYDLPIAYWETGRMLMQEEAVRLPEWAPTLGGGITDTQQKLDRKAQELELADMVVLASDFVKNSLPLSASRKKLVMAPFGTPIIGDTKAREYVKDSNKPLRVLFVGSMGQRKGLGDLFAAMKLLKTDAVELIVMGSIQAPLAFYRQQYQNFTYEPGRPHAEVLELMQTCDVFCLPSIVEGRALVMQEAMSQRLPLIITPNTGGEDLVIEGETGFLVPIRSPETIAEKITWFLDNRSEIPRMGRNAQLHAKTYTWEKYGQQIVSGIRELLA